VRVVIAEDSVFVRAGLARILERRGFEVVSQAENVEQLLLKVRSYATDAAVTDIRMPPTRTDEGLRAAKQIRAEHPGTAVLVLSQHAEPGYAMELLADSADGVGYLLKDRVSDAGEFADAVRRVARGGSALDPLVVSHVVGRRRAQAPLGELTPREREVLELMAEGRSNHGIAERLVVTEAAVEKQSARSSRSSASRPPPSSTAACSRCSRSCAPERARPRRASSAGDARSRRSSPRAWTTELDDPAYDDARGAVQAPRRRGGRCTCACL
jgi:DNA-binding NarL/FixJ family response regulator